MSYKYISHGTVAMTPLQLLNRLYEPLEGAYPSLVSSSWHIVADFNMLPAKADA